MGHLSGLVNTLNTLSLSIQTFQIDFFIRLGKRQSATYMEQKFIMKTLYTTEPFSFANHTFTKVKKINFQEH